MSVCLSVCHSSLVCCLADLRHSESIPPSLWRMQVCVLPRACMYRHAAFMRVVVPGAFLCRHGACKDVPFLEHSCVCVCHSSLVCCLAGLRPSESKCWFASFLEPSPVCFLGHVRLSLVCCLADLRPSESKCWFASFLEPSPVCCLADLRPS